MQLTALFLLAAGLTASASGFSQKVTLSEKNAPLEKVFQEIKQQTGYEFLYTDEMLRPAGLISINLKDVELTDALAACFKNQPLTYTIIERTVVVKVKKEAPGPMYADTIQRRLLTVTGRVTDEKGEGLAGASVEMKDGKKSTITDAKGVFELKNVPVRAVLVISYTGYQKREVMVNEDAPIMVVLPLAMNQLDQAQVIAYGVTTERLAVGNVTTVNEKEIAQQPVNNPLLALEGRVPGLVVTQATGVPGGGVTVRVQGQNSIANGNDPLYVIDGIPYTSQMLPTTSGVILGNSGAQGAGNPLNYINSGDIESIEVLKDADATAIYGSRAANGAILINTKKGKPGKTNVGIKLQNGWGQVTRRLNLLSTREYLQMREEALANDGRTPNPNSDYDLTLWDTTRYTDWQKVLIGNTAQYSTISGNISGGSENTQYLFGGMFDRETSVFPGSFSDQKGSVHFSLNTASANRKFRFELLENYLMDNNQLPQADVTSLAIGVPPDAPALYNPDGTLNWEPNSSGNTTFRNPLANNYNTYQNRTNNLVSSADLSYDILPGLRIKSNFGYTDIITNEFSGDPLIAKRPEVRANSERGASYSTSTIQSWIIEPQINYKRMLFGGKFDALLGSTIQQNKNDGQNYSGVGYNSDAVLRDIQAATSITINRVYNAIYKYTAVFGRINYNLYDKYLIDLTTRRDGSSRFGSENEFHNFGSVGAAWIFSQENLLKGSFLSFGKIRASYGTTGNDQIGDYQYLTLYNPISSAVAYQNVAALGPTGLPNPYIQWEDTKKAQFGVELGFSHDRILTAVNYAVNRSSNQLLPYNLPDFVGFTTVLENFPATVQNSDWEVSIKTNNIKGNVFNWTSSIYITVPANKLIAFPNLASSTYANTLIVGQPITINEVFRSEGVDPATGVYKFASKTDPFNPVTPDDATAIINTAPKFYGGFQNSLNYKGFEVDFLFQYSNQLGRNNLFNLSPIPGELGYGGVQGNQPTTVLSRWRTPGNITNIQRYNSDGSLYSSASYALNSNAAYTTASYFRLKNVSISYDMPSKYDQRIGMKSCSIYVRGQNLLTITKYDGLDPENQSIVSLPPLRILVIGIQATF